MHPLLHATYKSKSFAPAARSTLPLNLTCAPYKCNPDPNNPRGDCKTCRSVSPDSKKTIRRLPCLRRKIGKITVSRTDHPCGALGLTQRWRGFEMKDVGDLVSPETRSIQLSFGVCSSPITFEVRKFVPREGDVTFWRWWDGSVCKVAEIEPYALASVEQSARSFSDYLDKNAVSGIQAMSENMSMDRTVRDTYLWAIRAAHGLFPNLSQPNARVVIRSSVSLSSLDTSFLGRRHEDEAGDNRADDVEIDETYRQVSRARRGWAGTPLTRPRGWTLQLDQRTQPAAGPPLVTQDVTEPEQGTNAVLGARRRRIS